MRILTDLSACWKLRAIWYIVEVAAEMNDDISGSVVNIVWFRNATLLDYDEKVPFRLIT